MSIKKSLANMGIEAAKKYLRERLEKLKELDLDQDGKKDVDQLAALVTTVGDKVREAVESTDFQMLATGFEQVMAGGALIADSVDRHKLTAACVELAAGVKQAGKLLRLGVEEVKRSNERPA